MRTSHLPVVVRRTRALLALIVGAALGFAPAASALTPDEVAGRIAQAQKLLDAWQLDEAAAIAEELHQALPDIPPVQAIVGEVKFHQGDFLGAVRALERAAEGGVDPVLLALARSTYDETKGAIQAESEHFIVRTPPGKDQLLAPIALEALEQAYARVTDAFDYRPRHKIPVDVLHDTRGLASVSTLTVKEIETSGTIALCKFNRLMITSPKALARGYSWLDTLSHELIHLIISEKSRNAVPIWLHEGLAKYSETLWRGPAGLALEAPSENLLAAAVKKQKLITFEQMHPSMAKLPSQEDTALAFAEVFSVIEWMHTLEVGGGKRRGAPADDLVGYAVTNRLLDELAAGVSMDDALAVAVGEDLRAMQKTWRKYLAKRKFKLTPGAEPEVLRFVKNARGGRQSADDALDEEALREASSREGRRFVRLGGLLLRRGRARAASVEYEKALAEVGDASPVLNNRLAGLYLDLDDPGRAKELLARTESAHPNDPQTQVLLGRLALREKRLDDARRHYQRATWENPFNPEIHVALHQIAEAKGDAPAKARAEEALRALAGHARRVEERRLEPKQGEPFAVVRVMSVPWGELILDGVDTGMFTPVLDLRLAPGRHQVRVKDPASGQEASTEVVLEPGKTSTLELTLRPATADDVERWAKEAAAIVEAQKPKLPPPEPEGSDDEAELDDEAPPAAPWEIDDDEVP